MVGSPISALALRAAVLLAVVQALVFFWIGLFPFSTTGDPAFDMPLQRVALWQRLWQPNVCVVYLALLAAVALVERRARVFLLAALAGTTMLLAHALLLWEHAQVIGLGDLALPRGQALWVVTLGRVGCATFALGALALTWRLSRGPRQS